MKNLICLIFLAVIITQSQAQNRFWRIFPDSISIPICNDTEYKLVFEEHFEGNDLDLNKWELQNYGQGDLFMDDKDIHQVYTLDSDNVVVSDGTLKILTQNKPKLKKSVDWMNDTAIMADGLPNLRTYQYSSSCLWTKQNDFHYGKYEIRCRISKNKGSWPAFWLFSGDSSPDGKYWNELDFFEIYYDSERFPLRKRFTYTANSHFDFDNNGNTYNEQMPFGKKRKNNFEEWHTFTCYFTETEIRNYIDGELVNTKYRYKKATGAYRNCENGSGDYPPNAIKVLAGWPRNESQLIINSDLQGRNYPKKDEKYPFVFEIDYVKVWKQENVKTHISSLPIDFEFKIK